MVAKRWLGLAAVPALLIGSVLTAAASPARAAYADQACNKGIAHATTKLHNDIAHHGVDSRQAYLDRVDLQQAQAQCPGNYVAAVSAERALYGTVACELSIDRAETNLKSDIAHHGFRSRQAYLDRVDLRQAQAQCPIDRYRGDSVS